MELFRLELNKFQVRAISEFIRDLAKIIISSAVIGFFVPSAVGGVPSITFIFASVLATTFFITGIVILKPLNS